MTTLLQDAKHGLRQLGTSPAFAAVAVLTLALGIGANTAISSLLDALFLMPLPVPNASRLVDVYKTRNGRGYGELSYPDFVFYRDRSDAFSALAAQYPTAPINLVSSGESQELNGSVADQAALSLVLVTGAGLLLRSLRNVYRGPGYDVAHLAWLRLRPSLIGYPAAKAWAYQREVIRRLEALPGVVAASPDDYSPLRNSGNDVSIWLPGKPPARPELASRAGINQVGPRYFETLAVPFLQGREFNEQDRKDTASVAIVNETLAERMWLPGKAVGSILVVEGQPYRVIGAVKDAQYHAMNERPAGFVYVDYWQQDTNTSWGEDSRTMVRMAGDPRALVPLLRRAATSVDPNVPISEDRPMREWLADEFSPVRMALGAERSGIAAQVMRHGALLTLAGTAIGFGAALACGRLVASLLYDVRGYDPVALLAGPVLLIAVALLASCLPARRASSVDPAAALRFE